MRCEYLWRNKKSLSGYPSSLELLVCSEDMDRKCFFCVKVVLKVCIT